MAYISTLGHGQTAHGRGFINSEQCIYEPKHDICNNVVCVTTKGSDQPAHTHSLIRAFASRLFILTLRSLTEHHLEFLNLKGGFLCSTQLSMKFTTAHNNKNAYTYFFTN